MGSTQGEPGACRSKWAWFKYFSWTSGGFYGIQAFNPTDRGVASAHPGRGLGVCTGFASLRDDAWNPRLLGQITEEAAHTFQSHILMVKIEAQREGGVGACRCWMTRRLWRWRPPPGWNNTDESGSSCLIGSKELSSKNRVGWPRRQKIAEKMFRKVATGKVWTVVRGWKNGSPCVFSI